MRCVPRIAVLGGAFYVMVTLSLGCATAVTKHKLPPMEEVRSQIRKVAVMPAALPPREDFFSMKRVKPNPSDSSVQAGIKGEQTAGTEALVVEEDWKSVAEAAWSEGYDPDANLLDFFGLNPMVPIVFPVWFAPQAPIGLRMADEERSNTEKKIAHAYRRQNIQLDFSTQIFSAGKRLTDLDFQFADGRGPTNNNEASYYRGLGVSGADTALEVRLKDIGFIAGPGPDPLTALFLAAEFRAVRIADGYELSADETIYVSRKRKLSEWLGDGAQLLRLELDTGHAHMAERIIEKVFLVQEIAPLSAWAIGPCMFEIYSPKTPGIRFGHNYLNTPQIDTRRPLFRWEVFPRERDRNNDSAKLLSRITDITYDLKIWKTHDGYPQEVVYEKTGFSPVLNTIDIQTPDVSYPLNGSSTYKTVPRAVAEHRIEKQLEPSTVYFWSIRARFKLDGKIRVTKWTYSRGPYPWPSITDPCSSDHIDVMHFYRFITPGQ